MGLKKAYDELEITDGPLELNQNDITNVGAIDSESVNTETIGNNRLYAGSFDGTDPDTRLDNAISAAPVGATIYLEAAVYNAPRTIATNGLKFEGVGVRLRGTQIEADITCTADYVEFHDIYWKEGAHTLSGVTNNIIGGTIQSDMTIDGVLSIVSQVTGGSVTLGSNSIQCVVDSCAAFSVTDNGTNNIIGELS